uniref:Uncharacterized protein n=1 Tax=Globisporangium ultimum (strain ATCC 200006 / CBS 805.95 / DAOM BR144) TaxID=431595 RepID=K3WTC1_GLOUD
MDAMTHWKAEPEDDVQYQQQYQTSGSAGLCRFVHTQCEKELFTTEYLRSNKASGHKNLRCFPHCCGGHNPKSFCGSGLVVECFLPKCQIVLGRFEEVAKAPQSQPVPLKPPMSNSSNGTASPPPISTTSNNQDDDAAANTSATAIEIGHEYARQELFDEVKVPDQPFGKWFRGTVIPKAADRACFLINGNRQSWHYGWQSSRLNCKNLHVFKVYFFNQSESDAGALTCVAELASPAFRISSSRKARKTFRSPVMHPLSPAGGEDGATNNSGKLSLGGSRVLSIDELLGKATRDPGRVSMATQGQRRSLVEPLSLLEQQQQAIKSEPGRAVFSSAMRYPNLQRHSTAAAHAAAAVAASAENDHARRERKRLTRSASLKSDYFTNVSFPPLQQQQQHQLTMSSTHPPPQFAPYHHQNHHHPPQQQQQHHQGMAPRPLPSVAYMSGPRNINARRSSLAALPMPSPVPMAMTPAPVNPRVVAPVTTPIADMMQLRLESPHPPSAFQQQQQQQQQQRSALSSSAFGAATALHQHAYSSAKPTSFARRESWSAGGPPTHTHPPPPIYFPMIPASSPEGYLNRKRNRSTDSDKGLLAAIQASEALLASARGGNLSSSAYSEAEANGSGMNEGPDREDLHRRARVLQLAFTIIKRIHRFEEVSKANSNASAASTSTPSSQQHATRVYRHSFEMVIPSSAGVGVRGGKPSVPTLVQIPLSNHHILQLCSSLVSVCTALIQGGLLLDIRQRLVEYAQTSMEVYAAYAQLVDFIDDAVHEQVVLLPKRTNRPPRNGSERQQGSEQDADTWDLYDLLKNAEAWLMEEPWWCVTDADDAPDDDGEHADLPYYHHFADYYSAIQAAIPSQRDLEVAASLRDAALNGVRGLTGEWVRHGHHDEFNSPRPPRNASAASLSWLTRQIHGHMTQIFHLTETATTMTLALPQSLISSEAVFLFDLDNQGPTVFLPQDCNFPFGWTRKRLLVAYRAWRVRGISDENGSAVAVQFMRWPESSSNASDDEDEDDEDDEDDEPEEEPLAEKAASLLRTRVTIYFSVFSSNRLQVRTIVEGSMAPADVPALMSSSRHPTEADMRQYFKSPSSWELMSQVTQEYSRKPVHDDNNL